MFDVHLAADDEIGKKMTIWNVNTLSNEGGFLCVNIFPWLIDKCLKKEDTMESQL